MATVLEDLVAARAGAAQLLREAMTDTTAPGGKPNARLSADHQGYLRELRATINDLDRQIAAHQGPVSAETIGVL